VLPIDRDEVRQAMTSYTHGTPARPPRPLDARLQVVDVAAVVGDLGAEEPYRSFGRDSQTIVSDGPARVIVTLLDAGGDVGAATSDGHVSLYVVEGSCRLERGGEETTLAAGSLAVLAPGAPWSLRADARTAFVASFWQPG
jgi:quercetin dioxygenase-like cupin family protein